MMTLGSLRRSRGFGVLRGFGGDRRGATAVEFAVTLPLFLIVVSGVIDLGFALNQSSSLSNAARIGAQYAMRFPTDADGIKDAVQKAVTYDAASLTISTELTCKCADGTPAACTDTCSGTPPNAYVSVSVSKTYSSPLPTAMMLGITSLSSYAVMRAN
jgi:Flp pilus assembly protein TadG